MMSDRTVCFRTDASSEIGLGHLMRCAVLAQHLNQLGVDCVLVGPESQYLPFNIKKIFSDCITVSWASEIQDADNFLRIMTHKNSKLAVLDDYRVGSVYQQQLLAQEIKWLQFDGRANQPLWAHLIVNAQPHAKLSDYQCWLRRAHAQKIFIGPEFALLRPEFSNVEGKKTLNSSERQSPKALITFGGGDDKGLVLFSLESLYHTIPELSFRVLISEHNPNKHAIKSFISQLSSKRIQLYISPEYVQPIFADCDFAIMAGGTSTFEAIRCRLPMMLISIAENQVKQAKGWSNFGISVYLGSYDSLDAQFFCDSVKRFIVNLPEYEYNYKKSKKIVKDSSFLIAKALLLV